MNARKIAQDELNKSLAEQATQLATDEQVLRKLEDAIKSGAKYEDVFDDAMQGASVSAKEHALATKGAAGSTDVFVAKQKQAQVQLKATTAASKAASVAMKALSVAGSMFIGMAISWAIGEIIKGIDNFVHSSEKALELTDELKQKHNSLNSELESHKKTVDELSESYERLSKGVDVSTNKNLTLSDDDYKEYLDITNKLSEAFPVLQKTIDKNGNAILTLGQNGRTASEDLKLLLETEESLNNFKISQDIDGLFGGVKVQIDEAKKAIDAYNESSVELENDFEELKQLSSDGVDLFSSDHIQLSGDTSTEAGVEYYNALTRAIQNFTKELDGTRRYELSDVLNLDNIISMGENGVYDFYLNATYLTDEEKKMLQNEIKIQAKDVLPLVQDEINSVFMEQSEKKQAAELAWRDFIPSLVATMKSKGSFQDLANKEFGEDIQAFAIDLVSNLDMSVAEQLDENDPYAWVRDNIIFPLTQLSEEDRRIVSESYKLLFALDPKDLSESNQIAINTLIKTLAETLGKTEAELKLNLGFDVNDDITKYNNAITKAMNQFGISETHAKGIFNELGIDTAAEIDRWNEVTDSITDATEAKIKYNGTDTSNNNDILTLDQAKLQVEGSDEIIGLRDELAILQEVLTDTENVSIETYEKLIACSKDYVSAIKVEGDRVEVNRKKLNAITKQRQKEKKAAIEEASALKKLQWLDRAKELKYYDSKQDELTSSVYDAIDALAQEITQFDILANAIEEAGNAFAAFKEAQNMADTGDNYDTATEMAAAYEEALETGKIGTNIAKAAIEGFMDADTFKEFSKLSGKEQYEFARDYYNKNVEPYYHKDDDGEYAGDIDAFQKKATELGFSKLDENGNWEIIADKTFGGWVENLAKAMNLNEDMVYAMLGEMEEYSFDDSFDFTSTDFVDSQYNKMKDLIDARREYNKALESGSEEDRAKAQQNLNKATETYRDYMLNTAETVNNEYDTWNKSHEEGTTNQSFEEYVDENLSAEEQIEMYDALNEQLDTSKKKQKELQHQLAQVPKGSEAYNKLTEELKDCNKEVAELEEASGHLNGIIDIETVKEADLNRQVRAAQNVYDTYKENMNVLQTGMNADGTAATEEQLAAAARNVQQYADSLLSLPETVSTKIELDDSQVQAKINQVKTKIDTLKSDGTISSSEAQAYGTAIQQQKDLESGGTKALKAMLELDTEEAKGKLEEIQNAKIEDKQVNVNVIGNALSQLDTISSKLASLNGKSATVSVNVKGGGNLPGNIPNPSDTHRPVVDGTAHALGTAHANGTSWELPADEDNALLGELGTEGLVRNGKFYLIGTHGAEFQNLKKGDIIFNHKQTANLLKNGYITSRGRMLGGNAFVNGTALTTAHANDVTGGIYISTDNRKGKPNSNGEGNGDSIDDSTEDLKEATKEVFDWIERRIAKLQRLTDKWIKNAETALTSGFITKYFNKAAKTLNQELEVQEQAFHRYQAEADKSGLADEWKKKVNDGLVDIETITDETLAEQINDYQNWHDKSIACLEAFATAAEKRFNIPLEKAKIKIEKFSEILDLLGKKLDNARFKTQKQLNAANKLVNQQTKQEKKTLNAYKKAQKDSKSNLKKQSKAMQSSAVLKGDDVSKSDRKKVRQSVKNGKEIDLSLFREGSKAYQQAVKYNEALKANKQATYDAAVAQQEYNAWLVEASKIKFDNVAKYYENQIKMLEYRMSSYDRSIKEAEATANKINRQYYEAQKKVVSKELVKYQSELKALEERLKDIKPGTDEWYDAKDAIEEVKQSISDCVVQTAELNNAINQLYFDAHHNLKSDIDRIIAEQNLLTELFSHEANADSDIGNLTEAGLANLSSKTAIYELSKSKAEETGQIVKELQDMVNKGVLSNGKYTFNSLDDLKNNLKEFYAEWQDDIAETYQAQAAVVDLMKEKYQAELEMVQQLISDKKEALQAEKDLYSYQKSIKEKTTNINTLQRQLAAYSGDTSEEGMAKRQQLSTKLTDAQDDLKETEYEKYLSDQESMLDNLSTEYEELITKKLEDFQGLFQEGVGLANENLSHANDYLSEIASKNDYTIETSELIKGTDLATSTESIVNKLEEIHKVLNTVLPSAQKKDDTPKTDYSKYTQNIASSQVKSKNLQVQLDAINTKLSQKNLSKKQKEKLEHQKAKLTTQLNANNHQLYEAQLALANKYISEHLSDTTKAKSEFGAINKKLYSKFGKKVLSSAELKELASLLGTTYKEDKTSDSLYKLLKQISFPGFSKGGTVVSVDDINKRIKDNGDDALASVKVGESILTPVDSQNLANMVEMFRDINLNSDMIHQLNRLPDALNNVSNLQKTNAINYGGVEFNFEISNVSNADEIVSAIQNSKKVQKALQSVTVDRINGGGRLNVRSVK